MAIRNIMPYTACGLHSKSKRHCQSDYSSSRQSNTTAFSDSLGVNNDDRLRDSSRAGYVSQNFENTTIKTSVCFEDTDPLSESDSVDEMEVFCSESAFQAVDDRIHCATLELNQDSARILGGGRRNNGIDCRWRRKSGPENDQSEMSVSSSFNESISKKKVSPDTTQDWDNFLPLQTEEKPRRNCRLNSSRRSGLTNAGWSFKPLSFELVFLSLTLLCIAPVSGGFDRGGFQHQITWGRGNSPPGSAVFGNLPTNVTAVVGHKARLPCQVKNLGLKDVSWIRQRDLHILTVGIFTYTSDDRFKVFHPHETEDWFLDISSVTFRDSGIYECQVSTSPKVSLPIYLTVLGVQEADIPGPNEVFIQHGSTISLQCEVQAGVEAVGPVHWLKGADTLNYSSPRGGISMEVEKTPTKTMSKLYITRAVRKDSGNYTCAPLFAKPDSVMVHVVNAGEESAAAVHSGSCHWEQEATLLFWVATLFPVTWFLLNLSSVRP